MYKNLSLITLLSLSCYASFDATTLPWIQAHDGDEIKFVAPFLPENPVVLEAGVFDASDTCRMKARWPQATIYGFEPDPGSFACAQQRTRSLRNVFLYPYALADRNETLTFHLCQANHQASSLFKDNLCNIERPEGLKDFTSYGGGTDITVQGITIDEWAQQCNVKKIDYLWLDTEGTELYILQCAKSILATVKVISTEVNHKELRKGMTLFPDLYAFLVNEGFELKYIWGPSDWQGVAIFIRVDKTK